MDVSKTGIQNNSYKMNTAHIYRSLGATLALCAVILGAFGAHALKDALIAHDSVDTWETAVRYQMWHALALLLVSIISDKQHIPKATGACFTLGALLFSGSLYGLALDGPKWLGPITPLGGLCLIAGWALLAISCRTQK
jgi:uncharacterized membrane protein YgdD (TMEM256/DUF423 family)